MNKNLSKKIIITAVILLIVPLLFGIALTGQAVTSDDMLWGGMRGNVQSATGMGNEDPRVMAGAIIQVVLGFLGIIAVGLILYGGFKWMTAGGNEENVSTAKKILGAGVIGLVIVLMSFALANFVVEALYNATGAG